MSSPALETRPLHEICRALGSGGLGSGVSKSWCKKALPGVFPSPLEFDSTPTPGNESRSSPRSENGNRRAKPLALARSLAYAWVLVKELGLSYRNMEIVIFTK